MDYSLFHSALDSLVRGCRLCQAALEDLTHLYASNRPPLPAVETLVPAQPMPSPLPPYPDASVVDVHVEDPDWAPPLAATPPVVSGVTYLQTDGSPAPMSHATIRYE